MCVILALAKISAGKHLLQADDPCALTGGVGNLRNRSRDILFDAGGAAVLDCGNFDQVVIPEMTVPVGNLFPPRPVFSR
jgi:hypothetical protein